MTDVDGMTMLLSLTSRSRDASEGSADILLKTIAYKDVNMCALQHRFNATLEPSLQKLYDYVYSANI